MWTQNIFLQLHEYLGSDSCVTREHTTDTYITGAILVPRDRRWQGELAEGRIARISMERDQTSDAVKLTKLRSWDTDVSYN